MSATQNAINMPETIPLFLANRTNEAIKPRLRYARNKLQQLMESSYE